jgi:hypothetical protein
MPSDLHEASREVLEYLSMSMSGYMRRRLLELISDYSEQQQTHKFDDLLKRYRMGTR